MVPFPVFGSLPVATTAPYMPLTHTPGWHNRRWGGTRGRTVIREGQVRQKGWGKKHSPASHSFQLEPKNATKRARKMPNQQHRDPPFFFKTSPGKQYANSPPENFRRQRSQRAPIPHPSAHLRAGPERWDAAPSGIPRPSRDSAPKTVPNTHECCGTGHVHETLVSLHFMVSYGVTTVARKTLRLG